MRRAQLEDARAIKDLTCSCFGDAYTTEDEIKSFIADDNNKLYVTFDDMGLAGTVLFLNEKKENLILDLEIEPQDYDRISGGKQVLHHKFSAVREDLRKRGIMTNMLREAVQILEEEGKCGGVFVQAWIKQGTIPLEESLYRAGYERYKRQIRPWWKYKDRTCNICGGRCKCDAMVYYRTILR